MSNARPGDIIGYRKNGTPIRLIAGGSMPVEPPAPTPTAVPTAPVVPQYAPVPPGQWFTAEQLEAARQQEKDKLYGRLNAQDDQLKAFQASVAELQSKEAQREAEAQAAIKKAQDDAKAAADAKLSAEELIKQKTAELSQQQSEFMARLEAQQALLAREHEFQALASYIQRRVAEETAAETIAPEFLDYIDGKTQEEVEASISKAKEKTARIVAGMTGQQLPPGTPPAQVTPGVSPTGYVPSGPLDQLAGSRQYTAEQINAMNHDEFAAYRKSIGLDKAGYGKGMFS